VPVNVVVEDNCPEKTWQPPVTGPDGTKGDGGSRVNAVGMVGNPVAQSLSVVVSPQVAGQPAVQLRVT